MDVNVTYYRAETDTLNLVYTLVANWLNSWICDRRNNIMYVKPGTTCIA